MFFLKKKNSSNIKYDLNLRKIEQNSYLFSYVCESDSNGLLSVWFVLGWHCSCFNSRWRFWCGPDLMIDVESDGCYCCVRLFDRCCSCGFWIGFDSVGFAIVGIGMVIGSQFGLVEMLCSLCIKTWICAADSPLKMVMHPLTRWIW